MQKDEWSGGEDDSSFDPNASAIELKPEVFENHYVWCFGKNTDGELAQKNNLNVLAPKPLK